MTTGTPAPALAGLTSSLNWPGRPATGDLSTLPGCPAVYLWVDEQGRPVQLATTQQLKRAAVTRLSEPEQPLRGRADLAEIVRGIRWRETHSAFESRWWYYRLARELHPREYRELISFGPAWFLCIEWARTPPEIRISERIWSQAGEFLGPWPTHRAATQALEGLWDLFDLCRYPEQVRRVPRGVRCAYADMGRCDAPCDGSTPLAAYVERSRAAWRFAGGAFEQWQAQAGQRMREAARQQQFEQAGVVKQQILFADTWRREWAEHVQPAERLRYVLALRVTRRKAWKLFAFDRGLLHDGPVAAPGKLEKATGEWLADLDRRRMRGEENFEPGRADAALRMEQTWLVAHFLRHTEAKAAVVRRRTEDESVEAAAREIAERVRERLAARQAADADTTSEDEAVADREAGGAQPGSQAEDDGSPQTGERSG